MANRRSFMRTLSAGVLFAATGCAPVVNRLIPDYPRAYSRMPWAAPRVSMDAVIRVIVGHRPYRATGFRVEREAFDNKIVVHNYGHGGGGLSLGWGSSALAVREIGDLTPSKVAVVGSGIMGLCSARLLQDSGWHVTMYTRDLYRHTTSNLAAGEWAPYSTHDSSQVDAAFLARLDWASRISHHAYSNLTGPKYGIRWLEEYELSDSPFAGHEKQAFEDLFAYQDELEPGEHPFGQRFAKRLVTMQIDAATLLRQLTADFQLAGGNVVVRNFDSLETLLALKERVIFNCTGLGAATLFNDTELTPAKGQLVHLPPDPAVDYMTIGGGVGNLHMLPRGDVLLLGGIFREGDASRNVEDHETERIVQEHATLFSTFA